MVNLESNYEATGNGDYNVQIDEIGPLQANSGLDLTGSGQGLHVTGYGRAVAPSLDVSNCGVGVDARAGFLEIYDLIANNYTDDAVRLDGAIVDINSSTIDSPGGAGIHFVERGGMIAANNITVSNTGEQYPSCCSCDSGSYQCLHHRFTVPGSGGSVWRVYFSDGTTVTGSGNDDLNVGSGSTIIAKNCTTSTSTGELPIVAMLMFRSTP